MKNAIILHGVDETREDIMEMTNSPSNSHWLPWLQFELIKNDILAQTPEMPKPWDFGIDYNEWVNVFSKFIINSKSILIGHSTGAGFLLKYLSLNPSVKIDHLILVAPWLDIEQKLPTFFKDLELDKNLSQRVHKIDLFESEDDMDSVKSSVSKIKEIYGDQIIYHKFSNSGHFCEGDIGKEFPELLDVIIK
jgi:predicted alpha/beta hydrolase family esterase